MKKTEMSYKKKTAAALNELIKNRGLDEYLGKLSEDRIAIKLILTMSVIIGAASLVFILSKLVVLLLSSPFLVYIVVVTTAFSLYLMIKIENQEEDVSKESEEKDVKGKLDDKKSDE